MIQKWTTLASWPTLHISRDSSQFGHLPKKLWWMFSPKTVTLGLLWVLAGLMYYIGWIVKYYCYFLFSLFFGQYWIIISHWKMYCACYIIFPWCCHAALWNTYMYRSHFITLNFICWIIFNSYLCWWILLLKKKVVGSWKLNFHILKTTKLAIYHNWSGFFKWKFYQLYIQK